MKKIATIFTVLMLALASAFTLTGCGMFDFGVNGDNDDGENSVVNRAAEMGVVSSKCVVEAADDYRNEDMESFYDDNYNYWVFKMGMLIDIPLSDVFQYYKYTGGNVKYSYSLTKTTANSIKSNTQQSASKTTNWSNADKVSVKGGVNFGKKDVWGISIEAGYEHTWQNGGSETSAWSRAFETCEQNSVTESKSIDIAFDDTCPLGYYSYRYIGAAEVFVAIVQDRNTKQYNASTYTKMKAFGYSLDYDPDSLSFDNYDDGKFDFDMSIVNSLQEPTRYIGDGDEDVDIPNPVTELTVFDKTIRTGEEKIRGSGRYTLDSFTISESIEALIDSGYKSLSFEIAYDLKEVDNCKQYISLFTSTNIAIRDETTYHGGSSTKKSWETHYLSCSISLDRLDSNIFNFRCQAENKMWRDFYIGTVKVKVTAR